MITDFEHLPIGKYRDILAIPKDEDEATYNAKVVAILSDIPEDELLDMPLDKYLVLAGGTGFLMGPILDKGGRAPFTGKRFPDVVTLNGHRLSVCKDLRKVSVAQYVDYQTYSKGETVEALPQLLSCLLIPEGHAYLEGYDVVEVQNLIRDYMPVTDAYALAAFFLRTFLRFMRTTLTSSLARLKMKRNKTLREKVTIRRAERLLRSLSGGNGLQTWMRLLNSPAGAGMMSGALNLGNSLTSSPIEKTR